MKFVLAASLAATAAAFAPASHKASTTSLAAKSTSPYADELGAQIPLGFFDPLDVCGDIDKAEFERIRWVELKHGRVAMLAVVGYLTTEAGVRFPGAEGIPSGFAALTEVPGMVWAQFWATTALMEAANRDQEGKSGDFAGDWRNGYIDFGWDKFDDKTKMRKRAVELNNGRAAQMGILGLMVHEQLGNVDTLLPLKA